MDKKKMEKKILKVMEKYIDKVIFDYPDSHIENEIYVIKKEELPSVAKELADRIEIDKGIMKKVLSPIALSAGFNTEWLYETIEKIIKACPIRIKEADDET